MVKISQMQKGKEQEIGGRNDKKQKEKHVATMGEKTLKIKTEKTNFVLYLCGKFA